MGFAPFLGLAILQAMMPRSRARRLDDDVPVGWSIYTILMGAVVPVREPWWF